MQEMAGVNCLQGAASTKPAAVPERAGIFRLSRNVRKLAAVAAAKRNLVPVEGLEPPLLSEADFESAASTIPPHGHARR